MKNSVTHRLIVIGFPLAVVTIFVVSLFFYRDSMLRSQGIFDRKHWPEELLKRIDKDSGLASDPALDCRAHFVWHYVWRMSATDSRLKWHLDEFSLKEVTPGGVEHDKILVNLPYAWDRPTENVDIYAHPVGLPGTDDGEAEYVLLHDKTAGTLLFYYYRNF